MNKSLKNSLLALSCGVMASVAWLIPPMFFLIFIAFVPLIFIQDKATGKGRVFWPASLAFVTWNSLTTWWVWNSTPEGAIAMIILNSLFMTSVFCFYNRCKRLLFNNKKGFFILPMFVLAFEFLHYHWQLNWPWLTLGNVFAPHHYLIQWYELSGVAGGSLWILVVNILIYKIFSSDKKKKATILAICVIIIPMIASLIRYFSFEEKGDKVEVVVVQPNTDPYTEEFYLSDEEVMDRNIGCAEKVVTESTRFVLSPESTIQEGIWMHKPDYSYSIGRLYEYVDKQSNVAYIIGASTASLTSDCDDFAARKHNQFCYFEHNTALCVSRDGMQYRHKSRLTPGVEMMPSWWIVRPLAKMAIDLGGTSGTLKKDDTIRLFDHAGLRVGTLICYESVFGGFVRQFVRDGAEVLFVITNDGWWGDTPGHVQHLMMSKLRAIETRRAIARSANTGISAFINQRGDIVRQTRYDERIALKDNVITSNSKTLYVIIGDAIYTMAVIGAAGVLIFWIRRKINLKKINKCCH